MRVDHSRPGPDVHFAYPLCVMCFADYIQLAAACQSHKGIYKYQESKAAKCGKSGKKWLKSSRSGQRPSAAVKSCRSHQKLSEGVQTQPKVAKSGFKVRGMVVIWANSYSRLPTSGRPFSEGLTRVDLAGPTGNGQFAQQTKQNKYNKHNK